jgi:hypothetical protein
MQLDETSCKTVQRWQLTLVGHIRLCGVSVAMVGMGGLRQLEKIATSGVPSLRPCLVMVLQFFL